MTVTDNIFSISVRISAESYTVDVVQKLHACFGGNRSPMVDSNHGIAWRIKSEYAVRAKLRRRGDMGRINDFIGIRILAAHIDLLEKVEQKLSQWESDVGLQRVMRRSLFETPDESGYRAIHLDYRFVAPSTFGLPPTATVEVQLTTWIQHLHGNLSHSLFYKTMGNERLMAAAPLRAMSDRLHEVDKEIACRVEDGL